MNRHNLPCRKSAKSEGSRSSGHIVLDLRMRIQFEIFKLFMNINWQSRQNF